MKSKRAEKEALLQHYSNEVCSHVEAVISLFFGLVGTLIVMEVVNTVAAQAVFSIGYFALGGLGIYFYTRLFYYRKLLEGILLEDPYKDYHIKLQNHVVGRSRLIRLTLRLSRDAESAYRLNWAWLMLGLAVIIAFSAWATVFFSL